MAICELYAVKHGFKYIPRKIEYMVFEAGGKRPGAVPIITLDRLPLTREKQFKYLGHLLTTDL